MAEDDDVSARVDEAIEALDEVGMDELEGVHSLEFYEGVADHCQVRIAALRHELG